MTDPLTLWRAAAFAEPPQKVHDNSHQAAIGVDLAARLVRYIDGSAGHFPVHDALLAFDRACRRRHAHWPDHRGRPVCSEMVRLIIFGGASVLYCSEQLGMTYPRAERLLEAAIDYLRRKQAEWAAQWDMTVKARHDPDTCHDCLMMDPIRRRDHDIEGCQDCIQHRRAWVRTDDGPTHSRASCAICRASEAA